jgi:HAD superfamily hydrolase (TIGR01509 family)
VEAKRSGVLLDVDGTLVDSNDAHAQAWVDTFGELGYAIPFEKVRPLIGMGGEKLLPAAAGIEKDTPEGRELSERRTAHFTRKYLPALHAFPGVRALLERMRFDGHVLVVATSAGGSEAQGLLKVAGVEDLVNASTDADDAERSKPDPDIVRAALEKCGCAPEHALLLGDTPYDIDAGARSGIPVVALRCGGWGDDELAGAVALYDDPSDLLEHYDDSPFAPERLHRVNAPARHGRSAADGFR